MAPKKQPARKTRTTPAAIRGRPNPTHPEEPAVQHEENTGTEDRNRGPNGELLLTAVPTEGIPDGQPARHTPEAHLEDLSGRPSREAELFRAATNPANMRTDPTTGTQQGNPSTSTQPDVGDLMRAFLSTENAQELFRQYELEHQTGNRTPRRERPQRERSMEFIGEHKSAPFNMAAGFDMADSANPPPPPAQKHPSTTLTHDLRDLIQQNRGRGGHEGPRTGGIFDAYGRVQSPLFDDILNTPMPAGYKVLNIAPYVSPKSVRNRTKSYHSTSKQNPMSNLKENFAGQIIM